MRKQFYIQDWAGNVLDFKGTFKSNQLVVPLKFDTFDDGWEWIYTNIKDEEAHQDLYVEKDEE